jgi:flagella basal body P-ring formation protein FlgA
MRLLVIVTSLVLVHASITRGAEVRLRSAAACGTAVVRVADVAEVFTDDARAADALSDIPLCPAPMLDGHKTLSQADVRELLAQSGVDRKTANVTGSESVTITADVHHRATPGGKRPMVATGVRQATFEADLAANRKSTVRAIAKPQPTANVTDKQSSQAPLIERGSVVTVSASAAGIKVTTSGKALDDGAGGETISVELTDGKQRVLARVKGPQVVEVVE